MNIIDTIMASGKSAVDIALYTLIPIMVVMLVLMKYLESQGLLASFVSVATPGLKPFGLVGLSLFALIQLNFVSFAAPVATLAIMDRKGISDRHLAATLAMLFAMGQANVMYPLSSFGLNWPLTILLSMVGGLVASALTFYLFARPLSALEGEVLDRDQVAQKVPEGLIGLVNKAGNEAISIAIGAIPMLILSLTAVGILQSIGFIATLEQLLSPLLSWLHVPTVLVMPMLVKCLAGGTAYLAIVRDLIGTGKVDAHILNEYAGWFLQTIDLPGIGILLGAGMRIAKVARFAMVGGLVGIFVRGILHLVLF